VGTGAVVGDAAPDEPVQHGEGGFGHAPSTRPPACTVRVIAGSGTQWPVR
jgi:hypothetical protein